MGAFAAKGRGIASPSRRGLLKGFGAAALVSAPGMAWAEQALLADVSGPAKALMDRAVVIDMLGPLSLDFTSDAFRDALTPEEVEEFRTSGVTAFHNSYGVGGTDAHQSVLQYMAAWNGFVARNAGLFTLVDRAEDIQAAKESGKIAIIMGVQNSSHFRTPDDVELFYDLGQRVSQLTYNSQNRLGSGSTDRVDGGVSDFGASIIAKMNEIGMLVDVSHCGDQTTLDAIEISERPIAITHSNCRALNDHPRLKTDEAIRKLAAKGGVMGITGVRNFVRGEEPTTVEHIVDHIDHVAQLTGIEHVGVGTDTDLNGYDDMSPEMNKMLRASYKGSYAFRDKLDTDGFDDPAKFYHLTEALLRRGYGDDDVLLIMGGNFQRLLTEIWSDHDAYLEKKAAKEAEKASGDGE